MKWLTRSIVPSMVALAVLVAFFPRSGPTITLRASRLRYAPATLTIHRGDAITFQNDDRSTHTFTCRACGLDTGNVQPSQEQAVGPFPAGTFKFVCRYHEAQGMTGTLVVLAPGQTAPPSPTASLSPAAPGFGFPPGG